MNARQAVLEAIPERALQEQMRQLCLALGWTVYHPFWSERSTPGWPDLFLMRGGRIAVIELKTERGRLTKAQEAMLARFRETGKVEVYVVRPRDRDYIEEVLR